MSTYPGQGQQGGGQYPPPGNNPYPGGQQPPQQYPPPAGGQYPPAAGQQYPPVAGGQYPPAAGQYPPPSYPQGQPPSNYPPVPQTGFATQPGAGYPPPGLGPGGSNLAYPPSHPGAGHPGMDLDDSDPEYDIRSKHNQKPVNVRFVNTTGKKVDLQWINHEGEFEKCRKIKEGKSEILSTFEGHAFIINGRKKNTKFVINQNRVYFVRSMPGQAELVAEIKMNSHKSHGKDKHDKKDKHHKKDKHDKKGKHSKISNIKSTNGGRPVKVKFVNRSRSTVVIKWVGIDGAHQTVKELASKKCWFTDSCEGHYFTAHRHGQNDSHVELNYSDHYTPVLGGQFDKVIITEGRRSSSSSSSSSDSS